MALPEILDIYESDVKCYDVSQSKEGFTDAGGQMNNREEGDWFL